MRGGHRYFIHMLQPFTQTGREENWQSGPEWKTPLRKSKDKWTKSNEICNWKNRDATNSCRVKVDGVGVEGMMTFKTLAVEAIAWDGTTR